ncbi:hypothetical protein Acor_60480 [Acrocarpospora corrugata]|uniref:Uncharacterized protein n=1 Tax=Acrocarpospora corrugata TaxID=35763 RepID=A0A5M3W7P1_9ACTN|nr:hypothetical protein Acor_60480 [Acrocarpospora corrugata]
MKAGSAAAFAGDVRRVRTGISGTTRAMAIVAAIRRRERVSVFGRTCVILAHVRERGDMG